MMLLVLYFELSLAKLVLNLTQMGLINIPRCVALSFLREEGRAVANLPLS